MAVRKHLYHPDEVKEKIRVSQILNRLNGHSLGEVEMTATQVNAAKILLAKVIPDLRAIEHSGEIGNPDKVSDAELDARIAALVNKQGASNVNGG